MREQERRTPESSNVYSFVYQGEEDRTEKYRSWGSARKAGILYVTFKLWTPGMKTDSKRRPNVPEPTYVYYDVSPEKYDLFRNSISDGGKGAGVAVWDSLRVRGKGNFDGYFEGAFTTADRGNRIPHDDSTGRAP